RSNRRSLHAESVSVFGGQLALATKIERAVPREILQRCEGGVLAHRHLQHDAMAAAVFGHIRDSLRDRVRWTLDLNARAAQKDLARIGRREPKDRARHLGATRADEAR